MPTLRARRLGRFSIVSLVPAEHGVPTSVTFSATQPSHAVAAFRTGAAVLYDVEAARPVLTLESRAGGGELGPPACVPPFVTAGDTP